MVSALLGDCRIRSAFATLPPVRLEHFQECFAAQIASTFGCLHPDGTRYKYPAYDSKGEFCRDMKTAHAGLTVSDGDFDAFNSSLAVALMGNGLTDDEIMRVMRTFNASVTRADIVKVKDAALTNPTLPCDAGSGGTTRDAGRDADASSVPTPEPTPEPVPEPVPEAAPSEAGPDVSSD
jgi:hypothetical protein